MWIRCKTVKYFFPFLFFCPSQATVGDLRAFPTGHLILNHCSRGKWNKYDYK